MSNDIQPEIRFPGFTEDWEERKLDDVVEFYSGLTYSPDNVQEDGTFVLRSSNVKNGEIIDADNVYVSHEVVNSGNVQEGDVIVVVRNGSRDLIGKHAQIKRQMDNTVIGAFMTGVRSETPDFTNAMLDTQQFAVEINKNLGATINQITTGAFKKMQFVVPKDRDEREAIGTFFRSIDDTITLHQRKLDLLKETKKGFLQKMFPKNGAKVPEIRFPGFTGDWEERKLSEMAGFSKGNGYSKADLVEKGHPVILYGRLYTKYETVIEKVDTFAELKEKSVISNGGEVIVPASGETPEDISRASVVDVSGVALGGDLNIIKTKSELNPTFLALTISNGSQQKEMTKRAQGKSVVHLHNSDLKEVNLLCPKLDEQVKIGSFFKKLDVAITLHQRKLDLLKETKKGFLQKMFV
ncbi:restriction endonuclease subunit S [Enterococcus faecium]|uniref:restriction endonuclease subunit S n=1 Tax=Enterococcus faecium TaxID=1352 RepID=UPI00100DFBAA|nr:restriction endonuclease subunit S [Enterococcus faecium]RXW41202.1 restriction endonuclease subunit S [Enterococcus faecium]TKN34163.1 restriction endonuclease subunit S [Enterococcus faecium]TKN52033.1 restriction endonuclease subunit S [Enterococcus faecium]TKN52575.1 restriction endonuclease subunit S [Enterococcus faecium]TKO29617.1 restriction endonuclease subunit S [Enterococcus faecium]